MVLRKEGKGHHELWQRIVGCHEARSWMLIAQNCRRGDDPSRSRARWHYRRALQRFQRFQRALGNSGIPVKEDMGAEKEKDERGNTLGVCPEYTALTSFYNADAGSH